GRPAFNGNTIDELCHMQIEDIPDCPSRHNSELPLTLCNLVMKMIQKHPEDRHQSYSSLIDELKQFTDLEPPTEHEFTNPQSSPKQEVASSKSKLPLYLSIAVSVLSAGAYFILQ
ncbi:MAG: hypothetical protein HRT88_21610, partial [Lentisphaeraceae bacterium]|nr:hypothetical protein [Lentisphaeraceae bacterium]